LESRKKNYLSEGKEVKWLQSGGQLQFRTLELHGGRPFGRADQFHCPKFTVFLLETRQEWQRTGLQLSNGQMVFGNERDGVVGGKVGSAGLSLEVLLGTCEGHDFLFLGERGRMSCGRVRLGMEAAAAGFHILNLLLSLI
jgi:hypothetical protein